MSPTFILCRPRSRSTWLSHFIGACHDASAYCKSIEDYYQFPIIVDTYLAIHYEKLKNVFPNSKIFLLYRDKESCLKSLEEVSDVEVSIQDFEKVSSAVESLRDIIPTIYYENLDDKDYLKILYKNITGRDCSDWYVREYLLTKIETKAKDFMETVKNVWSI